MDKRPRSVTFMSCVFIAAGLFGLVYHATELQLSGPFQADVAWACLVRLLAVIGGVFALRGSNWARWLLLAWIAWHVVLSMHHSATEAAVHGALSVLVAWCLFRPRVAAHFSGPRPG